MTWLLSFWWFEFKFQEVQGGLYLFIIPYAVCLFLLAAILVPNRMEQVKDSYDYFMEGRSCSSVRTWSLSPWMLPTPS